MYYVNLSTGCLTDSTGNGRPSGSGIPCFVNSQIQEYTFRLLAGFDLTGEFFAGEFRLTGSTAFNSRTPCFSAVGTANASEGTITFAVDTYTEQYLKEIHHPDTAIFCDLTRRGVDENSDVRLALLICRADPRVWIPGVPPAALESYYTAAQIDSLLAPMVNCTTVLPEASLAVLGRVFIYIGNEKPYYYGSSYICREDAGKFYWEKVAGGTEGNISGGLGIIEAAAQTLEPGMPAAVSVTANGPDNARNLLFEFAIPQGLPGEKGEKGDSGEKGDKGDKGDAGADGVSVYTVDETLDAADVVIEVCEAYKLYRCGTISSLTVGALGNGADDSTIIFTAAENFTAVFPEELKWVNNANFAAHGTYVIVICAGLAAAAEVC